MDSKPKTRSHGVLVEDLDDGLVAYDSARQQAHALDAAAARVWRLADGTRTVEEISLRAGLHPEVTEATIARLQEENLLVDDPALSRRKLLKRTAVIGAGALAAAPLIETVLIPATAAHASTMVTPHFSPPPGQPGGPPMVSEQPPIVHTPTKPSVKKHPKKKKKKHLTHRRKRHKPPKRKPSFTGSPDRRASDPYSRWGL
jgi:hypothetical protein